MSLPAAGILPKRRNVACTNEECPAVALTGKPWTGQRSAVKALDAPCPKCASAVMLVTDAELPEPPDEPPPAEEPACAAMVAVVDGRLHCTLTDPAVFTTPQPLELVRVVSVRPRYLGIPRFSIGEVRVGPAARQRLAQIAKGKPLEEVAAGVLDRWAAGTLDPQGAA